MITDSIDIVNFEDTKCETQECKKCGAGNVVNGAAWQDAVRQLPGFTENVDGASFAPFQYFARRLLTQLKPELKQRLHDYIAGKLLRPYNDSFMMVASHHIGSCRWMDGLEALLSSWTCDASYTCLAVSSWRGMVMAFN